MDKNEKLIYRVVIGCFVLISIPILLLSFYNVPSVDDYAHGSLVYGWIQENGFQIAGILKNAVQYTMDQYFSWSGRYTDSFLMSLMPDMFGMYWLAGIVIYGALAGSIWYFFRVIIRNLADKKDSWMATIIAIFACVAITQNLPSAVEGFYWYSGAEAYMLHHALYIWMCALAIQYFFLDTGRAKVGCMIGLILLTICVAGGNQVLPLTSILTYGVFVAISFFLKRKREILLPFFVSIAGFLVNFLAPGTTVRGGGSSNYASIPATIIKCFRWTFRQYLLEWTTAWMVIMLLVLTPFLFRIVKKIRGNYGNRFRFPLLVVIASICFLSAMSSPAF